MSQVAPWGGGDVNRGWQTPLPASLDPLEASLDPLEASLDPLEDFSENIYIVKSYSDVSLNTSNIINFKLKQPRKAKLVALWHCIANVSQVDPGFQDQCGFVGFTTL